MSDQLNQSQPSPTSKLFTPTHNNTENKLDMVPPFGKNLTAASLNSLNNNKKLSYSEKKGVSSKIADGVDQNDNEEGNEYMMINTNGEMVYVGGGVNQKQNNKVIDYEKKN
jgi:hypothetical protein